MAMAMARQEKDMAKNFPDRAVPWHAKPGKARVGLAMAMAMAMATAKIKLFHHEGCQVQLRASLGKPRTRVRARASFFLDGGPPHLLQGLGFKDQSGANFENCVLS